MFVVDTNILLHAVNESAGPHARCRELIEKWRSQPTAWHVTWSILYEFVRVSTHARVFPKPLRAAAAWSFVEALLESPGLIPLVETDRHAEVAAAVMREHPVIAGNLVHDAHTAILMREHGVTRIVTLDMDFHHFSFVTVESLQA